jgi:thioesterase domain-containing protein/acyl carrier protein
LNGGCCAIYAGERTALGAIGDAIKQYGVTTLWLTSSLFNAAMDEAPEILAPLDQLLIGGEALSVGHVTKALAAFPRMQIINGYGPTECTTFSCCYPIPSDFDATRVSVPIGMPIGNTQAYILDSRMEPVADGIAGELFIGGDGVALGYLNRPELTAQAFVPDPFRTGGNRKLYRTGDRARWLPDGRGIEYLGRLDNQVKIRGFRVEPGEVEAALSRLPDVAQAAVTVQSDSSGVKRLVGYVVPANGHRPGTADLKVALAAWLPGYMIPGQFVLMSRLPLRPNGKVDHAALPPPEPETGFEKGPVPPRDKLERDLVDLWRELLGMPKAGIADDFFELGGDSLLALRLIARVEKQFQRSVPAATLFAAPTVEQFAKLLRGETGDLGLTVVTPGTGKAALFWIDPGAALGKLANRLGPGQPFFSVTLSAEELAGLRPQPPQLEDIAEAMAVKIERSNPGGPVMVASFCLRTLMAVEVARALRKRGLAVPLLILVDPSNPEWLGFIRSPAAPQYLASRAVVHLRQLGKLQPREWGAFLQGRADALWKRLGMQLWPHRPGFHNVPMERPMLAAAARHQTQPIDVALLVLRCVAPESLAKDQTAQSWARLARGGISVRSIPGGHVQMFDEPHVTDFAQVLREEIEQSLGGA